MTICTLTSRNCTTFYFQTEARNLENVKYVDATPGESKAYIRFSDESSAAAILKSNPQQWEKMEILKGKKEKEYWQKMMEDREEKFLNKRVAEKGRRKVMHRAEKLIGKKIRLSVDE